MMKHTLILLLSLLSLTANAQTSGGIVKRQTAKVGTSNPTKNQKVSTTRMSTSGKKNAPSATFHKKKSNTSQSHASYSDGVLTVNGVRYELVRVNAGTFTMGATSEMKSPSANENPAHQVTLTKDYYIGKTEVTWGLWKAVMGTTSSTEYMENNKPVGLVSWDGCQTFISKLNAMTGKHFRLPTEAEWEFAARGGNYSKHYQYSGSNNIDDVAWYSGNSNETHDVATKRPNELGIYDMSGNASEWCQDWYEFYPNATQTDPKGPSEGRRRITRGGSNSSGAWFCRSSYRGDHVPDTRYSNLGLRICLSE